MSRLLGSGATMVLCLVLGGFPAAAQTDNVVVTMTQECDLTASPIVSCTFTASDPRVTGTGGHQFVADFSAQDDFVRPGTDVALYWTDYWIEGPEGAWTGHGYLIGDDTGTINALLMLAGNDAYEGLSFVAFGRDPEADADHDLIGVIYEGPLPPVGSVPIPAGE